MNKTDKENLLKIKNDIENLSIQQQLLIVSGLLDKKNWNLAYTLLRKVSDEFELFSRYGTIVTNGVLKTVQPLTKDHAPKDKVVYSLRKNVKK